MKVFANIQTIFLFKVPVIFKNENIAERAPRAHTAKFADFLELNS